MDYRLDSQSYSIGYRAGQTDAYWERHGFNMHVEKELTHAMELLKLGTIKEWHIGFICGVYSNYRVNGGSIET